MRRPTNVTFSTDELDHVYKMACELYDITSVQARPLLQKYPIKGISHVMAVHAFAVMAHVISCDEMTDQQKKQLLHPDILLKIASKCLVTTDHDTHHKCQELLEAN